MNKERLSHLARQLKLLLYFVGKKTASIFVSIGNLIKKIKPAEAANEDVNEQLILKLNKKSIPSWQQFKQLNKILSKKEKIQLWLSTLIFLTVSFSLGWRIYAGQSTLMPAKGGTYTEGMISTPHLINPILASNDADRDLVKLVYAGLLKYDEQGNIVPDLTRAYSINPEQTVYTFELRDDIRWHDGQPVTADDVLFTVASIKNPDFGSPFKNSFNGVTVNKVNDNTIQFTLLHPFAPFLSALTVGLIPEHLWYSIPAFGASLAELNIKPIGAGPYKFKSLTRDANGNLKTYVLEAYDHYHWGQPYIKEFSFKFYPDIAAGVAALNNKNVDGLSFLPREYKNEIKNGQIQLHNLQLPQYYGVFFNPKNNSLLEDNKFRQALSLAVDKNRILSEVLNNDGQIIDSPILPGLAGYDAGIKGPAYDPEAAKKLLENMGWILPEGQNIRQKKNNKESTELTIKLSTVDQPENAKAVQIIKENWEAIGVKTNVEIISKDKIKQATIEPRQYEALLFGQVINTNSGPYPFWHSGQTQNPGLNLSVFANKDIDKYLDESRQLKTNEQKIESLKNFQKKLIESNFAIFLYNPTYIYPTTSKLKGMEKLHFINLPADRFDNVSSWYLKTKRTLSKQSN